MPPKLMVVCAAAYRVGQSGPGWGGSWDGELALRLSDDSVIRPSIPLSQRAWSDYSGSYSSGTRVELFETEGGWLLKLIDIATELFVPDRLHERERWLGDAEGRVWRRLEPSAQVTIGTIVDELETPGTVAQTIYLEKS